jgi:hypothetical protein
MKEKVRPMAEINKKFDELLQEKFESEKFEFKEEYWADALASIKAKRGFGLWQWISFSLSIIVIGLTILLSTANFGSTPTETAVNQHSQDPSAPLETAAVTSQNPFQENNNESLTIAADDDEPIEKTSPSNKDYSPNTANNNPGEKENTNISGNNPAPPIKPHTPKEPRKVKQASPPNTDNRPTADNGTDIGTPQTADNAGTSDKGEGPIKVRNEFVKYSPIAIQPRLLLEFKPLWFFESPLQLAISSNFAKPSIGGNRSQNKILVGLDYQSFYQQHKSNARENFNGDSLTITRPGNLSKYDLQPVSYNEIGLRVQKGKVGAKIGVGYGVIKENFKMNAEINSYSYDTSIHLIETAFGPDGDHWLIEKRIDSTFEQMVSHPDFESEKNNRISYIEIPVSFYIEQAIANRMTIIVGTGISFRKPISSSYSALNATEDGFDIIERPDMITVRNYNFYTQLNWLISPSWDLTAKVNFLNPGGTFIKNDGYLYASRNYGLGLTYWLKR